MTNKDNQEGPEAAEAAGAEQNAVIAKGAAETYGTQGLAAAIANGKSPLVKLGCDPTSPDLHLGHAVALRKVRELQDMGCLAVIVVGDFTASIGDPSGKSKTRPMLSEDEIRANAKTYGEQAMMILDPSKTTVAFNSTWFSKMSAADLVRLSSQATVSRILERDDFSKRHKEGIPIGVHEFLYPLLQAHDSVVLNPAIEIGGTDQTFNCLAGRELMRRLGMEPQGVITVPLLKGLDGKAKMSKSLGNHIGISEAPEDVFGKVMSVSDELMWEWLPLLSQGREGDEEAERTFVEKGGNPKDSKARLAFGIVKWLRGEEAALFAKESFDRRSKDKSAFDETAATVDLPARDKWTIGAVLRESGMASSSSEGERLVGAGAVSINGERLSNPKAIVEPGEHLVKAGKRNVKRIRLG